jgi:hypothetical protein
MIGNKKIGYCLVLMLGIGCVDLVFARDQGYAPSDKTSACTLQTCECFAADDECSLEVGKVSLHFSNNPMVHPLPSTVYTAKNNHIFFIPAADVSPRELRVMMDMAKKNSNKWYSVSLSLEKKPMAGIKIVFTFDPEKVAMEHRSFDILGTQQGVSFRFYNKSMINALRLKERSLLRVTQITPFSVTA